MGVDSGYTVAIAVAAGALLAAKWRLRAEDDAGKHLALWLAAAPIRMAAQYAAPSSSNYFERL